eukprot:TRINITY_DN103386_c0_g1_i1.p1 TRINITY_DN103386_c0_g1~~TRINITY_DN103386_c0_g1_i1.p1  ORF type:complete len:286 (-),score=60.54 TRINITY_DN103386_c0_g1_i1:26-883(-)
MAEQRGELRERRKGAVLEEPAPTTIGGSASNDVDLAWDEETDGGLVMDHDAGLLGGPGKHGRSRGQRCAIYLCISFVIFAAGVLVVWLASPATVNLLEAEFRKAVQSGDYESVRQSLDAEEEKRRNETTAQEQPAAAPSAVWSQVNAQGSQKMTALHWAAVRGHTSVADLLLERKANLEAKSAGGLTALHFAAREGHTSMAQHLVEVGANIDALDNDDWTPLHWAGRYDHADIAKTLVRLGADFTIGEEEEYGKAANALAQHEVASRTAAAAEAVRQRSSTTPQR